jgi:hypothetical protein
MLKVKQDSDCVRFFWGREFELIVHDTNGVLEVQPEVGLSTIIPLNDLQAIWLDIKKEDVGISSVDVLVSSTVCTNDSRFGQFASWNNIPCLLWRFGFAYQFRAVPTQNSKHRKQT